MTQSFSDLSGPGAEALHDECDEEGAERAEGQRSQVGPGFSACIIAQPVLSWSDRSVLLGVVECVNKRGGAYDDDDKTVLQVCERTELAVSGLWVQ